MTTNERFILWADPSFPGKELSVVVTDDSGVAWSNFLEFSVKDEDNNYDQQIGISPAHAEDFFDWLTEQHPLWADKVDDWRQKIAEHGERAEVT